MRRPDVCVFPPPQASTAGAGVAGTTVRQPAAQAPPPDRRRGSDAAAVSFLAGFRRGEGSRRTGCGPWTLGEPTLPHSLACLVSGPQREAPERFGACATGHPASALPRVSSAPGARQRPRSIAPPVCVGLQPTRRPPGPGTWPVEPPPAPQPGHPPAVALVGPGGGSTRGAMEGRGTGRTTHGLAAPRRAARQPSWRRRSLGIAGDRAADPGRTRSPTRPAAGHVHRLPVAWHRHGDLLQHHADERLPLWRGGLGRRPPARQGWRSTPEGVAFAPGACGGLCTAAPRRRVGLGWCLTHGLCPLPLQLTPHPPVGGLDGGLRTRGAVGTVGGALSARRPLGRPWAARGASSGCRCDAPGPGGGLTHGPALGDHPVIQHGARPAETPGGPSITRRPPARGTAMRGLATGAGRPATTTSPTP